MEFLYGSIRLGTADRFRSPVQIGTDPRLQCQAEALCMVRITPGLTPIAPPEDRLEGHAAHMSILIDRRLTIRSNRRLTLRVFSKDGRSFGRKLSGTAEKGDGRKGSK